MNKSVAAAIELIRAAAVAASHAELDEVLEAYRSAPLQSHDARRVFDAIKDREDELEAEADMYADRAMPESPYYA